MSFVPILRGLYDQYGELTADLVVEEARPKQSPLHPYFEWDDRRAAEQHRLEQARLMIRRVKFVVQSPDETPRMTREFRTVPGPVPGDEHRMVYRRVSDFTVEEREEVLERMRKAIASLVVQYREFDEFWDLLRQQTEEAA